MIISGQVGPQVLADGIATQGVRQVKTGDLAVSEVHGRFYEQNYRGNLFGGGMTVTSINNATFTSATTGATATPIVGLWNPLSSTVNLVVLQAAINVVLTALTVTSGAPYVWMASTGNSAISTGALGWNRKTLVQSGGQGKFFAGTALTGMANALAVMFGSSLGGGSIYNVSEVGTAAGFHTLNTGSVENLDGSIIVPPGGVIALMATTTPVAHSAASEILWEEVAV